MEKNVSVDNKKLNQLIKVSNKVLKNLHILVLVLTIYVSIKILNNLNIIHFLITLLKVLSPLFIGILIAWLLRPIVNYLENHNINRLFALILVYLLILFIFYISLITFIPRFIKELGEFIKVFPNILDSFFNNFKFINFSFYEPKISSMLNDFIASTSKSLPITFMNFIGGISSFIVGFIIGFYLLISNTWVTINANIKKDTYELIMNINNILRNYVKGTLLSSFIVFILSTIIFYIIGLDSALLFGFICGVTNIIPFIGPYIGASIPVLVAFTKNTTFGIIVTVMIFIVQTLEGNIIQPIIMSKSVKIHPVTSIISLLIFGYFFGILGMVFAVPLIASLKEMYYYLVKKYKNYKRNLVK